MYLEASKVAGDCRRGNIGRQIISTVYQYNHQHGSLNLPIEGLPQGVPIAIKVEPHTPPPPLPVPVLPLAAQMHFACMILQACKTALQ